ncbi:uncharacterized protein AMSG_08942 [Thecamonas trahens ATCC 50062]|uniref:SprT-like domain-containing protein n=1 Tax=Thecamonas trahens ATCC 50062 TaxID=461836 RepID=A0A0L0DMD7_THETB|nr:hypothetical protein AMSG_08942 [Thecamonas trahens ATCC 50062]KNC53435.1 hypothetical protein AMSG_08942 [Thecamonas trahens ATCC 50062]|eukprot:XP_013754470.1 hypothetical protein AMSG_08942 [Thecamonas trahens ATCC 50062]
MSIIDLTHSPSPPPSPPASSTATGVASWTLDVATPVHDLFLHFDRLFFSDRLAESGVSVVWSKRMTLCAGLCEWRGPLGGCTIKLSEKLLQFRSRADLLSTLLHEMIHAYLFLDASVSNREDHGPIFCQHMRRINAATGLSITVYHSAAAPASSSAP